MIDDYNQCNKTIRLQLNHLNPKKATNKPKLPLEVHLNRMKKIMDMKAEFHRNKQQYNQLSKEINDVQQQLKHKKKQIISQKLLKLHLQQSERLNRNKQSNQVLSKIKEQRKQRRKRMESLVSQYRHEYEEAYQKRLSQRKSHLQLNPKHDSQRVYVKFLHRQINNRIKTQSLDEVKQKKRRQRSFFQNPFKEEKQQMAIKKQKILELVNKRIQYGKKAEEASKNIKIPKQLIEQAKKLITKGGYDKDIDKYTQQQSRNRKARLDTNFSGDVQKNKSYQIQKIANNDSPTNDKLNRLRYIVDGFNQQYTNSGQSEVLDLMCKASIARANLLLKQS